MCKDDYYPWSYVSNVHLCQPPPSALWLSARNVSTWDAYARMRHSRDNIGFPPPGSVAWKLYGLMRTGTNFLEDFIGLNLPDAPPFLSSSDCIAPSQNGQLTNPWYWKHAVWPDGGGEYLSQLVHQANVKYGKEHVRERFFCNAAQEGASQHRDGTNRSEIAQVKTTRAETTRRPENLTIHSAPCQTLKWPQILDDQHNVGRRLRLWDMLLGHPTLFVARPRYVIVTKAPYAFLISMLKAEEHWRTLTTVKSQETEEAGWKVKEGKLGNSTSNASLFTLGHQPGVAVRIALAPGQDESSRARQDGIAHAKLYSKFLRGWLDTWHGLSGAPDEQGRIVFVAYEWALQDPESLTAYLSLALRFPRKTYDPLVSASRIKRKVCLAEMPRPNSMSPKDTATASRQKYIVSREYLRDTTLGGSYRSIFDPYFDRNAIEELGYHFTRDTFNASRAVYLPDSLRPLASRAGDANFHNCSLMVQSRVSRKLPQRKRISAPLMIWGGNTTRNTTKRPAPKTPSRSTPASRPTTGSRFGYSRPGQRSPGLKSPAAG